MARTGKKSVKSKPHLLKSQSLNSRIQKKKSNSAAKDRQLKDALDKELTSRDIVVKKLYKNGDSGGEKKKTKTAGEAEMLASFEQLRGM